MYKGREKNESYQCPGCNQSVSISVHIRRNREFGVKREYFIVNSGCQCSEKLSADDIVYYGRHPEMWNRPTQRGADLSKAVGKCSFDPSALTDIALGMFHCPQCGEMVVAGVPHPDYSLIN